MTHLEQLRAMTVEEVARDRVEFETESEYFFDRYIGDFGSVAIRCKRKEDGSWQLYKEAKAEAYAEALRLEIAWLNSETEGEK